MKCEDHIAQGDPRKLGYIDWHAKAAESHEKGEEQSRCPQCRLWFFPWEMLDSKGGLGES